MRDRAELRATEGRLSLALHLRADKSDIAQVVLARAEAVAPLPELVDPEYTRGLHQAIDTAVEYVFAAMESGWDQPPPVPPDLLVQARVAARNNVALSVVLRRYIAGCSAVSDFVVQMVERKRAPVSVVGEVSQLIRLLLDEIAGAVSAEHAAEEQRLVKSMGQLDAERVVRLLNGELRFTDNFSYDFHGRHLGIVASGLEAAGATKSFAKALEARSLRVAPGETSAWAWLQTSGEVSWSQLEDAAAEELIGQPLVKCASALEVALWLDAVSDGEPPDS
jgi:hypothetical protein